MDFERGMLRTFVAVVPPEDVLTRMEEFVARLRPMAPYKWVSRRQLHVTLRFLGEAPREKVESAAEALEKMEKKNSFDIRLSRAGGFPNLSRPRVIWIGADTRGARDLAELAADVEKVVTASGFQPETKKFKPHLTLARAREEGTPSIALAEALSNAPVFAWRCARFFLVKSDLTPGGPIYSTLREYRLGD